MSHQEKQRIFDEYAISQEFSDWDDLKNFYLENDIDLNDAIFEACDLVQEEQQKRIADKAEFNVSNDNDGEFIEINKSSILNPENLIK